MNNNTKGKFKAGKTPRATGIISQNPKRNTQMRVLHNRGENGKSASMTVHEAIDKSRPMIFPNHEYINYRRPYANKS